MMNRHTGSCTALYEDLQMYWKINRRTGRCTDVHEAEKEVTDGSMNSWPCMTSHLHM